MAGLTPVGGFGHWFNNKSTFFDLGFEMFLRGAVELVRRAAGIGLMLGVGSGDRLKVSKSNDIVPIRRTVDLKNRHGPSLIVTDSTFG